MEKKVVSTGIILLFLFSIVLQIIPIKASPRTIIVPDDYQKIQEAINAASEGDIIHVKAGTYNESITINKRIKVEGEGEKTLLNVSGKEVGVVIEAEKVEFRNFSVLGAEWTGIHVKSSNNLIEGNLFSGGTNGIYLVNYFGRTFIKIYNNTIRGNLIEANMYNGIALLMSDNNTIEGNLIVKNEDGVELTASSYNRIWSNVIQDNKFGLGLLQFATEAGIERTSSWNIVSKNLFVKNEHDIKGHYTSNNLIEENIMVNSSYAVYFSESSGNTIKRNRLIGTKIYLEEFSKGNIILENILESNSYIYLHQSSNNIIINNILNSSELGCYLTTNNLIEGNIIFNIYTGISLFGKYYKSFMPEMMISGNLIRNNAITNAQNGIYLGYAASNTIINNKIASSFHGIFFDTSNLNLISENRIEGCKYGILLGKGTGNRITRNLITNNDVGIDLDDFPNFFYHNNIINNREQVKAYTKSFWEKNYWSDHEFIDEFSGPYQNETGSDGISDKPYVIDEKNVDRYPLMKPFEMYDKLEPPPIGPERKIKVEIIPKKVEMEVLHATTFMISVTNLGLLKEHNLKVRVSVGDFLTEKELYLSFRESSTFNLDPFSNKTMELIVVPKNVGKYTLRVFAGTHIFGEILPAPDGVGNSDEATMIVKAGEIPKKEPAKRMIEWVVLGFLFFCILFTLIVLWLKRKKTKHIPPLF